MADPTGPKLYLLRHAETEWSRAGRHTGRTDVPLTEHGREVAREIGRHLHRDFALVLCSPLSRSHETARLAGFENEQVREDLLEWDYGDYEGLTTAEIRQRMPGWQLFRDGCPGGESAADVGRRADRVIARLRPLDCDSLVFSSGHFLRVLAARWLGLSAGEARLFLLGTTTLSILGYEHDRTDPVIRLWNDARPGDD
jgi:broad specificity phosphatase PhoE